jgi:hypothetical protein
MKKACLITGCCAFLGAAPLARGGNTPDAPAPAAPTPSASLTTTNPIQIKALPPPLLVLPSSDGAPMDAADYSTKPDNEEIADQTYLMNQEKKNEPDLQALDQEEKQQAYNNDWMLRDYTARLKKNGLESASETNPYLVPDPNADLTQQKSVDQDPLLAAPDTSTHRRDDSGAIDTSSQLTPKKSLVPLSFQPLLAPLNPTIAAKPGLLNQNTPNLTNDLGQMDQSAALLPVPGGMGARGNGTDLSDTSEDLLGVPGLTAASENGGVAPNNALDFEDTVSETATERDRARSGANNFLVPTAPTNDVAEFFKKQADALQAPTAPTVLQPAAAPAKPQPAEPPARIVEPRMSGIRAHVDDPFDILRR